MYKADLLYSSSILFALLFAGGAGWAGEGIPDLAERAEQPAEEEGAEEQDGAGRQAG